MADPKKTYPTYAIILLAALFFAAGIYALNAISLYTPDSTRYLVWARSLAAGAGYRDLSAPDPTRYVVHAPLYSLFLAPVACVAPSSIIAAKIVTLVVGVLMLFLAYRWFVPVAGERFALLGCLILAVNPLLFLYSIEVLSDVPFAASLLLSWLLLERLASAPEYRPGLAVAAAFAVAAALLLREIGVSVLLSGLAYLVMRKRFREAAIFFAIPALVYAGWYIRNELIIAPLENPPLTNAKIFSYHFFTGRDASFGQEFSARIANNVGIYAKQVADLLFAPLYFSMQYDVIPSTNPLLALMTAVLGILRIPLALFALGSTVAGIRADLKHSPSAFLRLFFLVAYAFVMLTYPINDIRFLLPMLLLSVYYCLVCWRTLPGEGGREKYRLLRPAIVVCALLSLVPNLAWDILFARTSAASERSNGGAAAAMPPDPATPAHFMKSFRQAGTWVSAHTDSDAVIMTQWKDLALWVGSRKVLNVDQTLLLDDFESELRDYHVTLLMSQVKKSGITEFAIPMHQSGKFAFRLLARVGYAEFYQVSPRRIGDTRPADDSPFALSLSALEEGSYNRADSILTGIWATNHQNITALYTLAMAKACAMQLREADSLFGLLRGYPQAGIYLTRASMHQQLINALATLGDTPSGSDRAERIAGIATGYWNAGLRFRARELIGEAFRQDSASLGAIVFGFHFALKEEDLGVARDLALRLEQSDPLHPLAKAFKSILEMNDSLRIVPTPDAKSALCYRIALQLSTIGLQEDAIDYLRRGIFEQPDDIACTLRLADIYVAKKRAYPARHLLLSFLSRHPDSTDARSRLELPLLQF